jgi:predicted ATP-dependent endonuclease of OLD family
MQLKKFRVENFRSIENSGEVEIAKLTSLVGRNESGKSNLLLALSTLNPPGRRQPLVKIKDFPRSRRIEDCKPDTLVVWTQWKLELQKPPSLRGFFPAPLTSKKSNSVAAMKPTCGFGFRSRNQP